MTDYITITIHGQEFTLSIQEAVTLRNELTREIDRSQNDYFDRIKGKHPDTSRDKISEREAEPQ